MATAGPIFDRKIKVLIVQRMFLVARDLQETVEDTHPGAEVRVCATLPEAERALTETGADILFLGIGGEELRQSRLPQMLRDSDTRVVVIDGAPGRYAPLHQSDATLPVPFVTDMVRGILTDLLQSR
ncbi:hypothetical protein EKE94_12075 [Mesobaculum littorinae]|uniref:Uncharacterized protein n=1 Tax=Mesobaculum littorinae TaxID=2486419 RepID=A0A438AHK1_9RHOB|nr:hypothetical protein [Mesobaculum littorinae]RVV98176.1 hypothetical protein EKE94_12075 [Mesobaculum littorinae]